MRFSNIALDGGGVKGIAYIGALKQFNNFGITKNFKNVVGTSVGSIFALFIACKCTNTDIDLYSKQFLNNIINPREGIVKESINLATKIGIHDNIVMYNSVNTLLKERYKIKNMTFKQLYSKTQINLTLVGTCLSTREIKYFNYLTEPDMEIARAIQISTSIPVFYCVTEWKNMKWADGGICKNFAIDYFDSKNGSFNTNTLGLLFDGEDNSTNVHNIDNIIDLLKGIEVTELNNNVAQSIGNYEGRNIIKIYTGNIKATDFKITEEQKQFLINNGIKAVYDFFKTDDWDDIKEKKGKEEKKVKDKKEEKEEEKEDKNLNYPVNPKLQESFEILPDLPQINEKILVESEYYSIYSSIKNKFTRLFYRN